jgi:hypothetical protein
MLILFGQALPGVDLALREGSCYRTNSTLLKSEDEKAMLELEAYTDGGMGNKSATAHFDSYRKTFSLRKPNLDNMRHQDELKDMSSAPDVLDVVEPPVKECLIGIPPTLERRAGEGAYIWLVRPSDVLYSLESGSSGKSLSRKRLAHTNLSGGAEAFCGGELWFKDESSVMITGGSSRYPPRSGDELSEVVDSFRAAGYMVASCGWSEEIDAPARLFREPEWG